MVVVLYRAVLFFYECCFFDVFRVCVLCFFSSRAVDEHHHVLLTVVKFLVACTNNK